VDPRREGGSRDHWAHHLPVDRVRISNFHMPHMISVLSIHKFFPRCGSRSCKSKSEVCMLSFLRIRGGCLLVLFVLISHMCWFITDLVYHWPFFLNAGGVGVQGRAAPTSARWVHLLIYYAHIFSVYEACHVVRKVKYVIYLLFLLMWMYNHRLAYIIEYISY